MGQFVLSIHQSTTESKASLVDNKGKIIIQVSNPLKPIFLKSGWIEYKPEDILKSQFDAIKTLLKKAGPKKKQINAIGITNQPSSIVMWDKSTGKPLYNAISNKDPRGSEICTKIADHRESVRERTGLPLSPYYSAAKIRWLLENIKSVKKFAEKGNLLCGTINTYIMWHLTKGAVYATDHTNAAQTLLFNIFTKTWDKELLELFEIPSDILPSILPTSNYFGDAVIDGQSIPIHANILENQASLIGNGCLLEGEVNINYGTDGFILINTGKKIFILPGLLTTVAWSNNGSTAYLLEGRVNAAGSIFEWMKTNLGVISNKDNLDEICKQSGERLFMLPAISGIGAPQWNNNITTCIYGLKSTTTREDIIRSAVEAIAFMVKDNLNVVEKDGRLQLKKIIASGAVSKIPYLLQFQSDLLHMPLHNSTEIDSVSKGAAFLAGINSKMWDGSSSIEKLIYTKKTSHPKLKEADVRALYERWRLTYLYSKEWSKNFS